MAILIHEHTQVLVQGITGKVGSFQAQIMKEYGTRIVAGVTPGKGGSESSASHSPSPPRPRAHAVRPYRMLPEVIAEFREMKVTPSPERALSHWDC